MASMRPVVYAASSLLACWVLTWVGPYFANGWPTSRENVEFWADMFDPPCSIERAERRGVYNRIDRRAVMQIGWAVARYRPVSRNEMYVLGVGIAR